MGISKEKVALASLWTILGQVVSLGITLISNIILARLLSPKEFGQMGIIIFFIIVATVLTESGFAGALVRKAKATFEDYSTVFSFNLILSVACYLILFASSQCIADFYRDSELVLLVRCIGLVLIFNALQIVYNAKLIIEFKFKERALYRFISILLSSILGISMAYFGYGVWSLICVYIFNSLIQLLLYVFNERIHFSFTFYKKSFLSLYKFGINTTVASLLNTTFDNIYQLIIARYFSIAQTGFYFQAKRIQEVPGNSLNLVVQNVFFSDLSKKQANREIFSESYSIYFSLICAVLGAFTLIFSLGADEIIHLLLGAEWSGASIFIKYLAFASFFYFLEQFYRIIFKVYDQTSKILKLEVIKKFIHILTIILGVFYESMDILLLGLIVTNLLSFLINYFSSKRYLNNHRRLAFVAAFAYGVSSLLFIIGNFLQHYIAMSAFQTLLYISFSLVVYFVGLEVCKIFRLSACMSMLKTYGGRKVKRS